MNIVKRAIELAKLESIMPSATQWAEAKKLLADLVKTIENKDFEIKTLKEWAEKDKQ